MQQQTPQAASYGAEPAPQVPLHLTRWRNPTRPGGAIPFEIGDRVTVAGPLEEPPHLCCNGKTGIVTRVAGALVQVEIEGEGFVAIDASNLRTPCSGPYLAPRASPRGRGWCPVIVEGL